MSDATHKPDGTEKPLSNDTSGQSGLCSMTARLSVRSHKAVRAWRKTVIGKRIVRKYRRFACHVEFRRLRAVIPALAERRSVSRVRIKHDRHDLFESHMSMSQT